MSRPLKACINLQALTHNLAQVRQLVPQSKVWAVIKANGYGHGVERVAHQLTAADGFAVASIDEAMILRQKGFIHRILLLEGVFHVDELRVVDQHNLDIVIHSIYQLDWLLTQAASEHFVHRFNIWLKLDTGMHRLGLNAKDFSQVLAQLQSSSLNYQLHVMSHFASADECEDFTQHQLQKFEQLTGSLSCAKSLANSAAIQGVKASHLDWVRPGIMLYGAGIAAQYRKRFKAVLTFKTQLISLKWIDTGEAVGYGQTWRAPRRTLLGTAAVGYGDGYPRHAPNGTPVLVNGQRVELVGRVSMDMITLDLTDLSAQVAIGDEVELWGEHLSVDEIARYAGTIGYELLCGITQRVAIEEL